MITSSLTSRSKAYKRPCSVRSTLVYN